MKIITVKDPPTKILAEHHPVRCDTKEEAETMYRKTNPDVLLAGMSSLALGPYAMAHITTLAHHDKKKIICFQDYWANHRNPQNRPLLRFWDAVIAPDDLAKKYLLEDGYRGEIFVTGNPAFQKFANVDVQSERMRLRKQFNVPHDAWVVLYAGTGTPQTVRADEATLRFLAEGMRAFAKQIPHFFCVVRPHPRDEHPDRYAQFLEGIATINTSSIPFADTLLPIADTVVSMFSTSLLHACLLRIPAVSILLPQAGRKQLQTLSLSDFPPNLVGASAGIYTEDRANLVSTLLRVRNDEAWRKEMALAQKKFSLIYAEKPAERVADAVARML